MPVSDNARLYAMYVIGKVESGWNWASVNYNDPITIGMMQWYGQRAANLISRCKEADPEGYEAFKQAAPRIAQYVEAGHDWDFWTGVYCTSAEGSAWGAWAEREGNHEAQQLQWYDDFDGYVTTLTGWGVPESNVKQLIFAMCMYHQSPAQCGKVLGSCGGSATLESMYTTCLNDGILGIYRNRYNDCYNMLKEWDGTSAPPDFGQADVDGGGGNSPGISQEQSSFTNIQMQDGLLYVMGVTGYPKGVICYPTGPKIWKPAFNSGGTPIEGGNTGGGSATGTEAQMQIRQWMLDHLDAFAYSQGAGRLSPETSGYTDCSGLCWYVYHIITGVNTGTWTGDMLNYGEKVAEGKGGLPLDQMQVGDLVLMMHRSYNPTYDHVEMYIGNDQLCGHGGPDPGPDVKEGSASEYMKTQYYWMVRRYINL